LLAPLAQQVPQDHQEALLAQLARQALQDRPEALLALPGLLEAEQPARLALRVLLEQLEQLEPQAPRGLQEAAPRGQQA
jgi:hypothetical protein